MVQQDIAGCVMLSKASLL